LGDTEVITGEIQPEDSSLREFAKRLDLPFTDYLLLSRALTHRSYLNEHPEALEDNERLEFLGDAVLDFLVGAWLYNHFPEMSEGELTRLRSALVRTEQLAAFAVEIGLSEVMRLGRGEEDGGGRNRPALLCGTFEALIGALYINRGLDAVSDFIEPILNRAVRDILEARGDQDPKSLLQEWVQAQGYGPPQYRIVGASGPEHEKTFEVEVLINGSSVARGYGPSKHSATKSAARAAMQNLGLE
jgi:ribonuclease-3